MPRRIPTEARFPARKAPQQARSRHTVEVIKQATLELAERQGFSSITTGDIADRAGVSSGTLYQYFPAREAIFLALYEDASERMVVVMRDLFGRILDLPLAEGVPKAIRRHLSLVREHRLVVLQMIREVPQLRARTELISYEAFIIGATRISLRKNMSGVALREVERRAFLIHVIVKNCIYEYLESPPPGTTDAAFIKDLAKIIELYSGGEAWRNGR